MDAVLELPTSGTRVRPDLLAELSPAAVEGFVAVADAWTLSEAERLTLLGHSVSRNVLYRWQAERAPKRPLNADQFLRISLMLGIWAGLERLFYHTPDEARAWVRRPNLDAVFQGRSPLQCMLEGGQFGLANTRRYVEQWAGGPPAEGSGTDAGDARPAAELGIWVDHIPPVRGTRAATEADATTHHG